MWYKIIIGTNWFGETKERDKLVRNFNRITRYSYISGIVPTLLEAKITVGDQFYQHVFSRSQKSGFRIEVVSGKSLSRSELVQIGRVILDNDILVRKLISFGWDTLEIQDNSEWSGCKWRLMDYSNLLESFM